MPKFSIVCFHRIGLTFVGKRPMVSRIIDQRLIGGELIGVVRYRLRAAVKHGLHNVCGSFPDDVPAHNTMRLSVYLRDDVDDVFFFPAKVKSSGGDVRLSQTRCRRESGEVH